MFVQVQRTLNCGRARPETTSSITILPTTEQSTSVHVRKLNFLRPLLILLCPSKQLLFVRFSQQNSLRIILFFDSIVLDFIAVRLPRELPISRYFCFVKFSRLLNTFAPSTLIFWGRGQLCFFTVFSSLVKNRQGVTSCCCLGVLKIKPVYQGRTQNFSVGGRGRGRGRGRLTLRLYIIYV
jgi:hypothetical protein